METFGWDYLDVMKVKVETESDKNAMVFKDQ